VKTKNPDWLEDAIFYQIYPQSYYDSNGDGIGDINGIIEKLGYIKSLGVNALWLNPCFVSPFQDAGYDVADYYKVAPRYGTNAGLQKLFKEAHRSGIKVCLDLVPGHTSIEHPWFKASARHKRNKYSDRYIWTKQVWDTGGGDIKFINGFAERDGNYAINFFYCQPALNYGFAKANPLALWQQPVDAPGPIAMRAELKKIMGFWLDKGADGFRVDMAASLVKNDDGRKETIKLWREIRTWMDSKYPDAVLISEWGQPAEAIAAGFHVDFMLPFDNTLGYSSLFFKGKEKHCFFDSRGGGTITDFLDEYQAQFKKSQDGYISVPSSNHDLPRPNWRRSKRDLEVIYAFLMTWPGVPFIYYGDEIGMRFVRNLPSKEGGYGRTGSRTPMQWGNGKNAGFSEAAKAKLYIPIDPWKTRPTVQVQEEQDGSLLNHIRRLIELRQNSPALGSKGRIFSLFAKPNKYPFVYLRQKGREKYIVAINPANKPVLALFDSQGLKESELSMGRGSKLSIMPKKTSVTMSGMSYGIFKVK